MTECIITRDHISLNDDADVTYVANALANISESKADAVRFLDRVIVKLDPSRIPKKRPLALEENGDESLLKVARPSSKEAPGAARVLDPSNGLLNDIYDEESKHAVITLCVIIPNDVNLCAYLIGRQGSYISEIRTKTHAKTVLERYVVATRPFLEI